MALGIWGSDYGRGLKCGMAGAPLPYDVPLESHFTEGWRDGVTIKGMTFGIAANAAATVNVKPFSLTDPDELPDDTSWWPPTWPEGVEGAARHIPTHRIAVAPHKPPPLTNWAGMRPRPPGPVGNGSNWFGN